LVSTTSLGASGFRIDHARLQRPVAREFGGSVRAEPRKRRDGFWKDSSTLTASF
jgi:hypothetical protein